MNSTWYKRREESVRTSLKRFLLLYLGEPLHRLLRFVSVLIIRHDDYQNKTDLHGIKIPLLGHCTVKPRLTYTRFIRPASYPNVSLSRWKCACKRRREGDNCTLLMAPCGSSPVTHVSCSILPCKKQSPWGGGWGLTVLQKQYLQRRKFLDSYAGLSGPSGSLHLRHLLLFRSLVLVRRQNVAPCKGSHDPGLWKSRVQLKESRIPLRVELRIQKDFNLVPVIRNPRFGIQNPRLFWIPSHGAKNGPINRG